MIRGVLGATKKEGAGRPKKRERTRKFFVGGYENDKGKSLTRVRKGVCHRIKDKKEMLITGIEPVTSALLARRSTD